MRIFLLPPIIGMLLLNNVYCQDQFFSEALVPSPNISVELQVVALPRAAALPLMRELLDPTKTEQAYEKIQGMLVAGTARLVGWPTLVTRPGQRTVAEGVTEFRYPTEFSSGGVGIYLTADGKDFLKQDAKISGVPLDAVPTSFETRNLGVTLELDPMLASDDQMIDVNVRAQNTWLKEMRSVKIERDVNEKITVEQPVIGANNVTTFLSLKSGQRVLLGSFTNSEAPDHMELFLFKVEVRKP